MSKDLENKLNETELEQITGAEGLEGSTGYLRRPLYQIGEKVLFNQEVGEITHILKFDERMGDYIYQIYVTSSRAYREGYEKDITPALG